MLQFLDPIFLIKTLGLLGIIIIIFAESGLFFGFFFPGDSLLFTAGFLASQGYFPIFFLCLGCILAAVLGDSVGYAFGKHIGPRLFNREDSFFFHKKHIERTKAFYEEHGNKTIILARFVPVIRTFAPILAGVGGMRYERFLSYNFIGGMIWGGGIPLLGFYLGNVVPNVDRYLLPIIILVVIVSSFPVFIEVAKGIRNRKKQ